MKRSLLVLVTMVGLLSGGFFMLDETDARAQSATSEQWVHANLIRVQVHGQWEEFPMVPLADHLCRSGNDLFRKHCGPRNGTSRVRP